LITKLLLLSLNDSKCTHTTVVARNEKYKRMVDINLKRAPLKREIEIYIGTIDSHAEWWIQS